MDVICALTLNGVTLVVGAYSFLTMKLMPRRQLTDKLAWHCRDNLCGSTLYDPVASSVRVGFDQEIHPSHLPMDAGLVSESRC